MLLQYEDDGTVRNGDVRYGQIHLCHVGGEPSHHIFKVTSVNMPLTADVATEIGQQLTKLDFGLVEESVIPTPYQSGNSGVNRGDG